MKGVFYSAFLALIFSAALTYANPWSESDFEYAGLRSQQSEVSTVVNADFSDELYALAGPKGPGPKPPTPPKPPKPPVRSVPEPSVVLLMVTGLSGLYMLSRRFRKK
ncbi:MAG TPA: PEP-CTERM sorting domain-containing protein [Chitinispirillaceae bacterium]|jgi:hypothetical protein|nr:PEP-CTERM sorting domain-containing protein [Chitinispirillaceae bacterium]